MIGFGICLPILPEHMQEILALNDGVLPAYMRGTGAYVAMHISCIAPPRGLIR